MKRKNIAVITGASSGIGREFARQIGEKYTKLDELWLLGRSEERLWELQAQLSLPAQVFPMDLEAEESRSRFAGILAKENPCIRMLVNSAGFGKLGDFASTACTEALGMIGLNCGALTYMTYSCLPYMPPKSRILEIGSAAAFTPQPGFAVYAATKAYVLSFSRALGRELKEREIGVTCVCPGPVDTAFFQRAGENGRMAGLKRLSMAKPEDVVKKTLADAARRRDVSVYGLPMKGAQLLSKAVPHGFLLSAMGKLL